MQTFDRLDALNSTTDDSMKPVSTGIGDLDRVITGLNRSDLILLAARPGMGKTSFALNIARYVACTAKKRLLFLFGNVKRTACQPFIVGRGSY